MSMGARPVGKDLRALEGITLEGRYVLEGFVAEGGFGAVYRARDQRDGRDVALKLLKAPEGLNAATELQQFFERFTLEARVIEKIRHPVVVQVAEFGTTKLPSGVGVAFIALEWIDGETLEAALTRRRGQGGRSPSEALGLLRPIFEAVQAAHSLGIAHRDLKPANILIERASQRVRLLDFGIAKAMQKDEVAGSGASRSTSFNLTFSPRYAAPEQLSGARTGPWTDVHALGLLLTEVLTDRPAYVATDLITLYPEALNPRRPTPGHLGVDVGPWEDLIDRALSLRPDDRFADAGSFLAALDQALEHPVAEASGAVTAVLPAVSAGPPKGSRVGRTVALAVGVLAVLGVVASVVLRSGPQVTTAARTPPEGSMAASLTAPAAPSLADAGVRPNAR
ncbi:MAG: serine/threonine protein kinase [Deltaproteobacteria bacterium]|jgi:serine/threonine protein kinase|nr:serine/threonine protein kinase [Deltaproteobacteria bacterium]